MTQPVPIIFALTYVGLALGRLPFVRLDRTGIVLLGVIALLLTGSVDPAAVGSAVDTPTLLLLFALMILSAQFQAAGFYYWVAERLAGHGEDQGKAHGDDKREALSPQRLLLGTIVVGGVLSALLANDIVAFAIAPVLARGLSKRGLPPTPFLIALAAACNGGSAATLIGNPQNILIAQVGHLDFWEFLNAGLVPALATLMITYVVVRLVWRKVFSGELVVTPQLWQAAGDEVVALDRWQALKGGLALLALIVIFASGYNREIGALTIAALLLLSRRMASRDMIGAVDWHLLVLIAGLFVVTDAMAQLPMTAEAVTWASERGFDPSKVSVMGPLLLLLSNSIGNVPGVMIFLSIWPDEFTHPLYALALFSTLAGNFMLTGSLANIIVAERAAAVGSRLSFLEHARCGVPITLLSMGLAAVWLVLQGWMGW